MPNEIHLPVSPDFTSWDAVLDELEQRLGRSAADQQVETDSWAPPAGLGPIPARLVDRATELLAGQRERAAELEVTKNEVIRHLGAVRAVPAMRQTSASVYLDVTG